MVSLKLTISSEYKSLFIPRWLYFIKRHIWRVKTFYKTVNKTRNLFNLSKYSPENSIENPVSRFSIGRKLLSIVQVLFSIGQIRIEQQSRHLETPGFFLYHFQSIEPKFRQIENNDFRIFT